MFFVRAGLSDHLDISVDTKEHKTKIIECRINKYHRKSFKLLEPQYILNI